MRSRRPAIAKSIVATAVIIAIAASAFGLVLLSPRQVPAAQSTSASSSGLSTASISATVSSSISGRSSSTTVPLAHPANESFQFVQASVGKVGSSIAVNATFRSGLPGPVSVSLVGVAYPAETGGNPYGFPNSLVCCPLVRSYSQTEVAVATNKIDANAHAQFSSTLVLPPLNGDAYVVKLYLTSSNGTVLSPVSEVFLQVTGGTVLGGQAGSGPTFFDSDNGLLYVADSGIDAVSVLNGSTGKLVATISLPDIIGDLKFFLYDPGNHELYVGSQDSPEVFAVDTSNNFIVGKLVTSEPGQSLGGMVYDPLNGKIFGINFVYSQVSVINDSTNKIVANITGILGPLSGIYDARSDQILVSAYNGTTFAIDAASSRIVGRVPTSATIFLYDPDNGLIYASETYQATTQNIVALDASTFQQVGPTISLSTSPGSFVFYDSFNKDIYLYSGQAFNSAGGDLIAISTASSSIVARISVPGLNGGLVEQEPSFLYDSANGDIYATELANPQNGTVGLLHIGANSNAVLSQTFPPKMPLNDISLDVKDGMLYGTYGPSSSTIFSLNLSSGAVNTIAVGTCQTYGLAP